MDDSATQDDLRAMEKEAMSEDPFDTLKLRRAMWFDLKAGRAELLCRSCAYGKVVMIAYANTNVPWKLWGRILQGFHIPFTRIFFFASPHQRKLKYPVTADCVNGGYTFPCNTNAVVVYRAEEATRVLIHELLHAACTDNHELPVELKEAKTETMAELFYIAFLSKGSPRTAARLWAIQSQWIADLNHELRTKYKVLGPQDYAYRYTVAREEELALHGISLPFPKKRWMSLNSCRFTSAELDAYLF